MYIQAMETGKTRFSMPLGQKLLGGLGLPAVILLIGLGAYVHSPRHAVAGLIVAGVVAVGVGAVFFGRTVVLRPEGIAYGYLFRSGRPIPWAQVTDITAASAPGYRGVGRGSWHVELHFRGGGGLRLPVPYGVGDEPGDAFCADFEALRQRWHQERGHAKKLEQGQAKKLRQGHTKKPRGSKLGG